MIVHNPTVLRLSPSLNFCLEGKIQSKDSMGESSEVQTHSLHLISPSLLVLLEEEHNLPQKKKNTSCYPWSLHLICKGQRIEWKSITIQISKSEPNKFTIKLFSLDPMTSINCPILVKSLRVTWDMKNIKQAEQAAPRSQQLIYQWKGVV